MDSEIIPQVRSLMCDVFDVDEIAISRSTTAKDIEEWDSLSHIRLIVAIERHFGIKFNSLEVEGFKCVGDLADSIAKKTDGRA